MNIATRTILTVAILSVMATACSSPRDGLVGEWQSTGPESVHVTFHTDAAPTGPAGEGRGWSRLSYTENGESYAAYWAVNSNSALLISSGGIGGLYEGTALVRKIVSMSSNKLVLEWGFRSPVRVIEFKRVK